MIFITSLLFINCFILVAALLIIVLDNAISNYGTVSITINDDKDFEAPGGKSLLKTLFENKYFIPSACGGKGTCGYCKVTVNEGGGAVLPTESLILTPGEMKQNVRLSCQVKVRENMRLNIAPEYLELKEYSGTILSSEPVTSDIKKIRIGLVDPDVISFKAGQYVQIKVEGSDGTDYRAYSIASNPDITNEIELNIKLIPEGLGSSYMHNLKKGDPCQFSGPYGDFFLHTDSTHTIVCVAGGVGLAPIKSIVSYWAVHQKHRPIQLYYGSRSEKELYDHDWFAALAQKNENFSYYPALSESAGDWNGETGFIHTVIGRKLTNGATAEAYMCGPQIMIDFATKVLQEKGVPAERIWYDKF